jgi:hypothetical protein
MSVASKRAVAAHRARLRRRGLVRLEVHVPRGDANLVRRLAKALGDPRQQNEARMLLRGRFGEEEALDLKAYLASAPLEGIELERDQGFDRYVDL